MEETPSLGKEKLCPIFHGGKFKRGSGPAYEVWVHGIESTPSRLYKRRCWKRVLSRAEPPTGAQQTRRKSDRLLSQARNQLPNFRRKRKNPAETDCEKEKVTWEKKLSWRRLLKKDRVVCKTLGEAIPIGGILLSLGKKEGHYLFRKAGPKRGEIMYRLCSGALEGAQGQRASIEAGWILGATPRVGPLLPS